MRLLILFLFCIFSLLAQAQQTAFLKVHFIYGSKPLKAFKHKEKRWFGGLMGGHVGIEGDSGQIGDFLKEGKLHLVAKKYNRHSRFNRGSVRNFYKIFDTPPDSVKKTIVYIPVSIAQKRKFDDIVNGYLQETPYDYAFLGMRCAAASYDILGQLNIFPRYSQGKTYRKIFYPKKLRRRLLKKAEENGWIVDRCEGSCMRRWEQD